MPDAPTTALDRLNEALKIAIPDYMDNRAASLYVNVFGKFRCDAVGEVSGTGDTPDDAVQDCARALAKFTAGMVMRRRENLDRAMEIHRKVEGLLDV